MLGMGGRVGRGRRRRPVSCGLTLIRRRRSRGRHAAAGRGVEIAAGGISLIISASCAFTASVYDIYPVYDALYEHRSFIAQVYLYRRKQRVSAARESLLKIYSLYVSALHLLYHQPCRLKAYLFYALTDIRLTAREPEKPLSVSLGKFINIARSHAPALFLRNAHPARSRRAYLNALLRQSVCHAPHALMINITYRAHVGLKSSLLLRPQPISHKE